MGKRRNVGKTVDLRDLKNRAKSLIQASGQGGITKDDIGKALKVSQQDLNNILGSIIQGKSAYHKQGDTYFYQE